MAKIQVIKPFKLNLGGDIQEFGIGSHNVSDEIAEHWYVKVHTQEEAEAEPEQVEEAAEEAKTEAKPKQRKTKQEA